MELLRWVGFPPRKHATRGFAVRVCSFRVYRRKPEVMARSGLLELFPRSVTRPPVAASVNATLELYPIVSQMLKYAATGKGTRRCSERGYTPSFWRSVPP